MPSSVLNHLPNRFLSLAGCLAILLAACSGASSPSQSSSPAATPTSQAAECPSQALDTSAWQTIKAQGFSFKLPADYSQKEVQGIDSYVGQWQASEQRFISFDYGSYSSTLAEAQDILSNYGECSLTTAAFKAKVVYGTDAKGTWISEGAKYVVAASWRDLKPQTHLSFTTTAASAQEAGLLFAILRSVRFDG